MPRVEILAKANRRGGAMTKSVRAHQVLLYKLRYVPSGQARGCFLGLLLKKWPGCVDVSESLDLLFIEHWLNIELALALPHSARGVRVDPSP
jgi:hypothetical protein